MQISYPTAKKKLIRQNRLEYFKKYGKQRHGIRKNNGYGIRIRCIIHQPKREKPVTVPEKAPAQIILSPVSYTHLDVYKRQGIRRTSPETGGKYSVPAFPNGCADRQRP